MNAIHVLTDDKQAIRRYRLTYSGIRKRYVEVLHNSFLVHVKIEFRHVKSHTVICDARSYVNEWCDTEAKKKIDFLIKQIEA